MQYVNSDWIKLGAGHSDKNTVGILCLKFAKKDLKLLLSTPTNTQRELCEVMTLLLW